MRIVIDLQGAQTESRFRGIGRYSLSIAKAIARNRGEHEIIIALSGLFPDTIEDIRVAFDGILPNENIRVWHAIAPTRECEEGNEYRRESSEILREAFLASLQPDVILLTSLFEGFVDNAVTSIKKFDITTKVAVILYDLIPYIHQDKYLNSNPQYKKHYLQKIEYFKKADLFLGISQSSSNEAIDYLKINQQQVVNISSAVDESFKINNFIEIDKEKLFNQYNITKKTIVYAPGGFDIRKNFENLIKAFAKLPLQIKNEYQLVIVSKVGDDNRQRLLNLAKDEGLGQDDLILTGYVSDDDLISFYTLCDLFVFASIHEGFGLPVLEAMNCGAVVIGSNTTSIPEVIGCEEALFDPYSVESMRDKIEQVLIDKELQGRLKEHNKIQVGKFSWDKSAKVILSVLNETATKASRTSLSIDNLINTVADICLDCEDTALLSIAEAISKNIKNSRSIRTKKSAYTVRIEGPFDSSYSLALVNREFARGLKSFGQNVILHSTEGPGDFEPNQDFLNMNEDLALMNQQVKDFPHELVDVVSRNLYPPRVHDMSSRLNMLHNYAWEESGFPREWVENFNNYLDGIACTSKYVRKIFIDNGILVPSFISSNGVDHWIRIETDKNYTIKAKTFKFLHVSSCFPRKGVDAMLEGYGHAFTKNDDISLIIKTFENPHNNVKELLKKAQELNPNYPHVVIIEEDMSDEKLKALYEQCDVLVAPSKAEGFGLPMAEAMLSGLPVITTNWGGQLDFCNSENSWLVDYEFEYAQTHFNIFGSVWAKVNVEDLSQKMMDAYKTPQIQRSNMSLQGKELLLKDFKWGDICSRFIEHVNLLNLGFMNDDNLKLGWITTWNSKCGIATYSEHLISNLSIDSRVKIFAPRDQKLLSYDTQNVERNWSMGKDSNDLQNILNVALKDKLSTIIIQFNYGFFNHKELEEFILQCKKNNLIVIAMLHSTVHPLDKEPKWNFDLEFIKTSLTKCDRLLVHSVSDLNRLKHIGLVDNVAIFPHGVLNYDNVNPKKDSSEIPTVASYGFCLPHKGLPELVEAAHILNTRGTPIKLKLVNAEYPVPESVELIEKLKSQIKKYKLEELVELNNKFLEDSESLQELSKANLLVFAYQNTGESASGAVRYGMATKLPVLVTPLKIFDDLADSVFKTNGITPKEIADGIQKTLGDITNQTKEAQHILSQADRWRKSNDYKIVGKRLENICKSLLINGNINAH